MTKKNAMGSETIKGFSCKPKVLDENKPIMYSALHIFICDGQRCKEVSSEDIAEKVRNIVKELELEKGENRVKVTRTQCNGACRYKIFIYAYINAMAKDFNPAFAFTAWKNADKYTNEHWKDLILSLLAGNEPETIAEFRVYDKVYYEVSNHKS
jgi:hypothetical protein